MAINVFLDTEFTNFEFPSLISIGLVSDTGAEFYAEVPYSRNECSEFVLEVVIPLLDRGVARRHSFDQLKKKLIEWLEELRQNNSELVIHFDSQTDWDLLKKALNFQLPCWCIGKFMPMDLGENIAEEFYVLNQLAAHHALNDALANRHVFLNSK